MDVLCMILSIDLLLLFVIGFTNFGFNKTSKALLKFLIAIQFYWVILLMINPRTRITTIRTNKFKSYRFSEVVMITKIETYKPTSSIFYNNVTYRGTISKKTLRGVCYGCFLRYSLYFSYIYA